MKFCFNEKINKRILLDNYGTIFNQIYLEEGLYPSFSNFICIHFYCVRTCICSSVHVSAVAYMYLQYITSCYLSCIILRLIVAIRRIITFIFIFQCFSGTHVNAASINYYFQHKYLLLCLYYYFLLSYDYY